MLTENLQHPYRPPNMYGVYLCRVSFHGGSRAVAAGQLRQRRQTPIVRTPRAKLTPHHIHQDQRLVVTISFLWFCKPPAASADMAKSMLPALPPKQCRQWRQMCLAVILKIRTHLKLNDSGGAPMDRDFRTDPTRQCRALSAGWKWLAGTLSAKRLIGLSMIFLGAR